MVVFGITTSSPGPGLACHRSRCDCRCRYLDDPDRRANHGGNGDDNDDDNDDNDDNDATAPTSPAAGQAAKSDHHRHHTTAARAASINTSRDGPFAKEVKKYYPHETWHGGKIDDICVVVAVVQEERPQPEPEPMFEPDHRPIKSRL